MCGTASTAGRACEPPLIRGLLAIVHVAGMKTAKAGDGRAGQAHVACRMAAPTAQTSLELSVTTPTRGLVPTVASGMPRRWTFPIAT
jgi:hypothetical protein